MVNDLLLAALSMVAQSTANCTQSGDGVPLEVEVDGWKDRAGRVRVELYPDNDRDFLADDGKLLAAGKTFRRVDVATPQSPRVSLCIMAPAAGRYALVVLHDRDGNHKFGLVPDGVGFGGNPKLGFSKPKAQASSVTVAPGGTRTRVVLNYRRGLSMRPLE